MMKVTDIKTVACVGVGLIGSSWATSFAQNGYAVRAYDAAPDSLKLAEERIRNNFQLYLDNGYMTQQQVEDALGRISYHTSLAETVKGADFIQESGPETLSVKQDLVAQMDAANPDAIICSSTSGLNISDIAAKSARAHRYVGGHPYNPPHLMPLVELTKWEKTDEALLQVAYDLYKAIKKEPVILLKESPGFIGNRLQVAYWKEAIEIIMDGVCSIEDLDKASIYGLGIRWAILGPNLNGHLNGGEGGIQSYFGGHLGAGWAKAFQRVLDSKINEVPTEFKTKIAPEGIAEELKNRAPETGNTPEEVVAYRDKSLLGILNVLGKI